MHVVLLLDAYCILVCRAWVESRIILFRRHGIAETIVMATKTHLYIRLQNIKVPA